MLKDQEIKQIINSSKLFTSEQIREVTRLAGDASSKEFYRIKTFDKKYPRLILMKLVPSSGPLSSGESITQDKAFIEVANILRTNQLAIPDIYWYSSDYQYCLVEDLGDNILANYLNPNFNEDIKYSKFTNAARLISRIQAIPKDNSSIIFKREISYENYLEESQRFFYYTDQFDLKDNQKQTIYKFIKHIARAVSTHPQSVVFRDYTAWNIVIDNEGDTRLVDFQDMLIGSYTYDIVSLIHDRDCDYKLGDEVVNRLICEYCESCQSNTSFKQHYAESLIQRHLRLAGQFLKLTEITGKNQYADWIPGSMQRLGQFMANYPEANETNQILASKCNSFAKGLSKAKYEV